ncbi:histidinol-phosphate transaminase [Ascidiimonas aurantiaca]|uniref:histidinol-phosphate transaminase n=1 Tax=Ascidiimonas aurantiaca TaxID=1685432 RepID=UPI0030EB8DBF
MNKTFDISKLVRPNVAALIPYTSARDEFKDFKKEMVFLDANENPFPSRVNRYPDPRQRDVKQLLREQRGLSENQMLLGNGSDEVLDLILRAFCRPGIDNMITLPPTYGMYGVLGATNDIENRKVLLTEDFCIDTDAVLRTADANTKVVFICSPNNPTGNLIPKEDILILLRQFAGLVVIDEAYIDFAETESWVNTLSEYPNLIVTQTLSKAYGMAGIRLGLCFASEEIISILNKIKPPYNINQLTQLEALERLENPEAIQKEKEEVLKERNILENTLKDLSYVKKVFPSDANFILARVDNAAERYQSLLKMGIVVRNRSAQPLCEETLRFTVGTPEENSKLIQALKKMS